MYFENFPALFHHKTWSIWHCHPQVTGQTLLYLVSSQFPSYCICSTVPRWKVISRVQALCSLRYNHKVPAIRAPRLKIFSYTQNETRHFHIFAPINSKLRHPPEQPPGHLNFWRLARLNFRPPSWPKLCSNDCKMPNNKWYSSFKTVRF